MNVIVTDQGFSVNDWPEATMPLEDFDADADMNATALDISGDIAPEVLEGRLSQLTHIRISVASFADGRGFTLARQLRRMGFQGRLRVRGPLIADQYAMARRSGFDDVEIPQDLAERQPESDWLARADWRAAHYQARLQG